MIFYSRLTSKNIPFFALYVPLFSIEIIAEKAVLHLTTHHLHKKRSRIAVLYTKKPPRTPPQREESSTVFVYRVCVFSVVSFSSAKKLLRTKGFSGNYPRPGSYNLTTMYREGYRVLLTLLQFFATKFLFLALHLESGCFPRPLTAREEAAAFSALRAGDAAAREKLIRHNLRLVAHIVKKYYALPGDQEDLVSIGTIGLMKAVDTFDATRKARFSTYASRCIENAILSPAHFQMEKRTHSFCKAA